MNVQPGDVILYPVTPQSSLASRLVAILELIGMYGRSQTIYSHCAIMAERTGFEYEARWPKSGMFLIDNSRPYEIWNVGNPSKEQRSQILSWCGSNCGKWYNLIGLLTGGLLGIKHHEVCSQFVDDAYSSARPSIMISNEGKRIVSPDAIADSHKAVRIYVHRPAGG